MSSRLRRTSEAAHVRPRRTCAANVGLLLVWRLAGAATALAIVVPVMTVGRRPYRIGRLAERLDAISDMDLTPTWLPNALRWFGVLVVATALTALVCPRRWRRLHALLAAATLACGLAIRAGAGRSDLTSPTWQLTAVLASLAGAVVAALVPAGVGSRA